MRLEDLTKTPNALAPSYSMFDVANRLLLTGHSHQAWPDVAREGQLEAFVDAARLVDGKWERAEAKADRVRRGFAALLGDAPARIALGASTHELVVRFLSGLPLRKRPRLVTTDGEFHSIRRQLDRLAEEGIEIVKVAADPADTTAERLSGAVDSRTAAVLVSAVFFRSGRICRGLDAVLSACERHGAALLVDAYHALDVLPFDLTAQGLTGAYVVGGGYKYCQLGEGNCFLRFPEGCTLRPVVTGWFGELGHIAETAPAGEVVYGPGGERFSGSTYDPTSHYRAARVFDFFAEQGLDPAFLCAVSRHQLGRLADRFDALDLDPAVVTRDRGAPVSELGGFLVLESRCAEEISVRLRAHGVHTDFRGHSLRLGPAPYLSDAQIDEAVQALGEVVCEMLR